MRTIPQQVTTSTLAEALAAGCDIVQPKLRGLWCRVEVTQGRATVYSPSNEELTYFDVANPDVFCTLIGDYFGPPRHELSKIIAWDCWALGEVSGESPRPVWVDITMYSYRDRFAFLKQRQFLIGLPVQVIKNYPISAVHDLWTNPNEDFCGVVFRCSRDPVTVPVRVQRKYKEVPAGVV